MVQITFQLDEKDAEKLRAEAHDSCRTQSQLVRFALREYFDKIEKKRARRERKAA